MYLRAAEEHDLANIVDLLNREIVSGVAHFGTEPHDLSSFTHDWRVHSERYPWLVCIGDQDEFLGFAKASAWKPRGAYARSVEISVYLEPAARGRGVASWLYALLFEELWTRGFYTIVAGITLPNPASVRLHERHGMKHVGTLHKIGYKAGQWRDVGYWQRHLGEGTGSPPE